MHSNIYIYIYIYGCIWPFLIIYSPFWHLRGAQDLFTVHSHPGSWCTLHQADTAILQCHPPSMKRAEAPAQLPGHVVIQINKVPYK